jgi:plastocyanin domain-containing protein
MRVALVALLVIVSCKQQLPAVSQSGVVDVAVTEKGFEPERVQAKAGQAVTLRFTRKAVQTCADAVRVQGDPVEHMLPLNAPVDVKVTAPASGELAFACPMNMYRGAIVVVAQ